MYSHNILASAVQLVSIASLASTVTALPGNGRPIARQVSDERVKGQSYDYIIAGGGLSGLVVANRLTEDPKVKVLVVEYGGFDNSDAANIPYLGNNLNFASQIPLTSAPDANLNNASFPVFIGGVVGGGTIVNGLAYDRGSAQDYDAWEQLGSSAWGFSDLLPYFKKGTTLNTPSAATAKEFGITWDQKAYGAGPLRAALTEFQFPDIKKFWAGWKSFGFPTPREHGLGDAVGLWWMPSSINAALGRRSDARNEYYDPVQNRTNLQLLTGTTVDEVLFAPNTLTARGVSFTNRASGAVSQAYATREVILAAGAINTPKILQLSGIGPAAVLSAAKIPQKLNLPAVGANFQDHPVCFLGFNLSNQAVPNGMTLATDPAYNATAFAQYEANKTGIYSSARGNGVAFLSLPQVASTEFAESLSSRLSAQDARQFLPAAYADPELYAGYLAQREILANHLGGSDTAMSEFPFNGGTGSVAASLQKPLSRGTVSVNPADPKGMPVVQYNSLQNPLDAEMILKIVRLARKFFQTDAMKSLSPVETAPGAQYQTDADLLKALIGQGVLNPSFAHPSGTCALMPRKLGGCVDNGLLVYGTKKLSVIDGSILPLIPAAHLQATIYGVAEKAADVIKARNR